jgi:mono/diheme cytochrome c family protein
MIRKILLFLLAVVAVTASGVRPAAAQKPDAKKLNKFVGDPVAAKQGRSLFLKFGCSGCHGVGGGGGMGPPIIDDTWKYGSDDETLYRLITGQIEESQMPRNFGEVLAEEEVWKILTYIRTQYAGDPALADW